jgi:hypothetical protein
MVCVLGSGETAQGGFEATVVVNHCAAEQQKSLETHHCRVVQCRKTDFGLHFWQFWSLETDSVVFYEVEDIR